MLSPLKVLFKCLNASKGTVAKGLPSSANKVSSELSRNAFTGISRMALNPKSKTY